MTYQSNSPDYPPGQPPAAPPPAPGGYPPPAAPGGYPPPGGGYPPMAPTPPKKSGRSMVRIVLYVIVALVVVIGGIVAYVQSRSKPAATAVGDCMVGQSAETLKKIACTDAKAEWKVVGRVADKTESESTVEKTCSPWPDADTLYWEGKKGEKGFALCLAPIKK